MLGELRALLDAVPASATKTEYRRVIIEENILAKRTLATRRLTAKYLTELYALDPQLPLFRVLRYLWGADKEGRPLLALLCAVARDPILRMTAGPILKAKEGQIVPKGELETVVAEACLGRFSPNSLASIGRNTASSWTQSGRLRIKKRGHPVATPANATYAILLGYLEGIRGQILLDTIWTHLLDVPTDRLYGLASEAARRGWIDFLHVGPVVEIRFPVLLTPAERDASRVAD